jgi:hypothetical protein
VFVRSHTECKSGEIMQAPKDASFRLDISPYFSRGSSCVRVLSLPSFPSPTSIVPVVLLLVFYFLVCCTSVIENEKKINSRSQSTLLVHAHGCCKCRFLLYYCILFNSLSLAFLLVNTAERHDKCFPHCGFICQLWLFI